MIEQSRETVRKIIQHLVAGEFAELEKLSKGHRLTALEMAKALSDYGRTLILPPEDAYRLMDVVAVRNANPPRLSVEMPLWTQEEGRSDLGVSLTLIADGESFEFELDDIHVL